MHYVDFYDTRYGPGPAIIAGSIVCSVVLIRSKLLCKGVVGNSGVHRRHIRPDLTPMDFRVFPKVKSQLRGIRFASKQELTVAAKRIVSSFDADWYRDTFDKWISRHIKCIRVGGGQPTCDVTLCKDLLIWVLLRNCDVTLCKDLLIWILLTV
ncbi:hypothetical protein DPMN_183378 [Dreissena polymorpha]|uniref:Uncharacterized protein n=1 Tax=Dreissena polymorpha TaxID=45954 RepID=A0A9D4DGI2_DREPO|nr:hypothetical protein DPMN_183378 [Dreissena polymorpha]